LDYEPGPYAQFGISFFYPINSIEAEKDVDSMNQGVPMKCMKMT